MYIVIGRVINKNRLAGIVVYGVKDRDTRLVRKEKLGTLFSSYNILNCRYDGKSLHSIDNKYSVKNLPIYSINGKLLSGNNKGYISALIRYFIENYVNISGSRVTSIDNIEANQIAAEMYEGFKRRDRKQFVANIAKNTGMKLEDIDNVYQHIFINEHYLSGKGKVTTFEPDYAMAQSFMRLSKMNGKDILKHDRVMIQHEILEYTEYIRMRDEYRKENGKDIKGKNEGIVLDKAHKIASMKYDYDTEVKAYYSRKGMI